MTRHTLPARTGLASRGLIRIASTALLGLALLASPARAEDRYQLDSNDWKKIAEADPASPEGKLQKIRRAIAEERPEDAKDLADDWIDQYPNHPMLVEAYLLRGDSRVAKGNEYRALYDYEYVIRMYPGSEQFITALEREYQIAQIYSAGRKRKFLGMRMISAGGEAEEIFIRIQERTPGSELGEKASLALADHYFKRGEMVNAAEAYDLFLINYPRSQYRERAMLRCIQSNLATFKGPKFDGTGLVEAAQRIKQYQSEFPAAADRLGAEALLVRIDESLGLKSFYNAGWYETRDRRRSAIVMYQRVIRDHPQTAAARAAMDELIRLEAPLTAEPGRTFSTTRPVAPPPATTRPEAKPAEPKPDAPRAPAKPRNDSRVIDPTEKPAPPEKPAPGVPPTNSPVEDKP